jgi:septum formation protein
MLILASKSPRRKELLKKIYPGAFAIIPADIDERSIKASRQEDLPYRIAEAKGLRISLSHPEDYVLAADTAVFCQGEEFEKPEDGKDAFRMLTALNETEHQVITGYHIFFNGKDFYSGSAVTVLRLKNLTPERIRAYISTGSPFDKAGAYGIQDKAYIDSEIISGSFDNVMGFPSEEILKGLRELKLL